jgi:hypothetical protein
LLQRLCLERRGKGSRDAGIIDQPVQLAFALQDAVDDAFPIGFARRVVLLESCLAADLLHGLESAWAIDVGDDHRRAFLGEQLGRGAADARSGAAHQHHLACNPAHAFLPNLS